MDVVIHHNPACGTSRNVLALIRNSGIEPFVVEYLRSPSTKALLARSTARAGLKSQDLLRRKGTPYRELNLDNPDLSDVAQMEMMIEHPILIERPLVISRKGARLCGPTERVLCLLTPQRGEFFKEDGKRVVDERRWRVATA